LLESTGDEGRNRIPLLFFSLNRTDNEVFPLNGLDNASRIDAAPSAVLYDTLGTTVTKLDAPDLPEPPTGKAMRRNCRLTEPSRRIVRP